MIGVDIVVIDRIESSLQKHGEKFLRRYLLEEEISLVKRAETAAGFWAAKEAIAKALGTGIGSELGFHDIKIEKDEKGAPFFRLPSDLVKRYKIVSTSLSIAHDGGFAIAVAAIESSPTADKM
ncbi:holo-ACP synthase [Hydrogenimonas cancrithermarum]|uniref:Holo-[acyl-carrier-protein] synthase n=1 Tax=Hydrogenimonas cancrithermarum TaxID=2993563 RepID=A0ABN6WTZ7_9BACT|nr:holo-ACP synthase [Hydrogenimonas cancrithermarum]BDY12150.1 holo-[acyl-carrier-protein] synthase [Hydrogenimonas cancrithermarum]